MAFTDLNTVHVPSTNALVPLAWGQQIGANFDALVRVPHFRLVRNSSSDVIGNDTVVDLTFDTVTSHTGQFFRDTTGEVSDFSAPFSGLYAVTLNTFWTLSATTSTTGFRTILLLNDVERLRQAARLSSASIIMSGLVSMNEGDTFSFNVTQGSGANATVTGDAAVIYVGAM